MLSLSGPELRRRTSENGIAQAPEIISNAMLVLGVFGYDDCILYLKRPMPTCLLFAVDAVCSTSCRNVVRCCRLDVHEPWFIHCLFSRKLLGNSNVTPEPFDTPDCQP